MAIKRFTGFELGAVRGSGVAPEWDCHLASPPAFMTFVTSPVHSGIYALRVNPSAASGSWNVRGVAASGTTTGFALSTAYVTMHIYVQTRPSANATVITRVQTTGGGRNMDLSMDTDGKLFITAGTPSTKVATSLNTWYRVEMKCVQNSTCELYVDQADSNLSTLIGTATAPNNNIGEVAIGPQSSSTFDIVFDDVIVDDAARVGPIQGIFNLPPNTTGSINWILGTNTLYTEVDDIPPNSDTDYIKDATSGHTATFGITDPNDLQFGGGIISVMPWAIVRDEGAVSSVILRLTATGANADTAGIDPSNVYNFITNVLNTDPSGGPWSNNDARFSIVTMVNNASQAMRCTALGVWILTKAAPPGNPVTTVIAGARGAQLRQAPSHHIPHVVLDQLTGLPPGPGQAPVPQRPLFVPVAQRGGPIQDVTSLDWASDPLNGPPVTNRPPGSAIFLPALAARLNTQDVTSLDVAATPPPPPPPPPPASHAAISAHFLRKALIIAHDELLTLRDFHDALPVVTTPSAGYRQPGAAKLIRALSGSSVIHSARNGIARFRPPGGPGSGR